MWKMTFNKVRGKKLPFVNSGKWHVLLHKATHFKLTISSSFQSQSTLFWELFKWEKICNSVQIGGIVMFNNLFYVNFFFEIGIDFCLYMLSIIALRKKIGICKNRYWQVRLPKNRESAKKIAIGASLKCNIRTLLLFCYTVLTYTLHNFFLFWCNYY